MEPEQLQLGFLKVLKGSYMEEMAPSYGLCYSSRPPYEVLSTRWLSYRDILELKGVEDMTEVYYNSRQFVHTLLSLWEHTVRLMKCFWIWLHFTGRTISPASAQPDSQI